jgi:hypothetical protein
MFYGPMSGVQLSYGITQSAYYTHDPIYLPYGPPLRRRHSSQVQSHLFSCKDPFSI